MMVILGVLFPASVEAPLSPCQSHPFREVRFPSPVPRPPPRLAGRAPSRRIGQLFFSQARPLWTVFLRKNLPPSRKRHRFFFFWSPGATPLPQIRPSFFFLASDGFPGASLFFEPKTVLSMPPFSFGNFFFFLAEGLFRMTLFGSCAFPPKKMHRRDPFPQKNQAPLPI